MPALTSPNYHITIMSDTILRKHSYLQLTVKRPLLEEDTTVSSALVAVHVYDPSSPLTRLLMVKVELARPTILGSLILILPPFDTTTPSFFHVTFDSGFPSISHHIVAVSPSFFVAFSGLAKMNGGSAKEN